MRSLAILLVTAGPASAGEAELAPGRYRVEIETTMPNIDLRGARLSVEICWKGATDPAMPLGPLGPGPLRDCPSSARWTEDGLTVATRCLGPNSASALAHYRLRPGGFTGRVEMNMGGKNMTVGERQEGVQVGECG